MNKLALSASALLAAIAIPVSSLSAAAVVNGDFRHEMTDQVFSTQINGDSNAYTDGVNFSADWVSKYTWYVRNNTSGNSGLSRLVSPTVTGNNTSTASFTWLNNGPGSAGIARYDNVMTTTVIDGATPGSGMSISRMSFKANSGNAAAQTYQLFLVFDGNVVGGGNAENITSSVDTNGTVTGAFTDSGAGVINYLISGSPTIFQAGADGTSVAGRPLRNVAGTSSTVYPTTNLTAASSFNDGTNSGTIAAQWTLTMGPSDPEKVIDFIFAINQPIPEPTTLSALASAALLMTRRRK